MRGTTAPDTEYFADDDTVDAYFNDDEDTAAPFTEAEQVPLINHDPYDADAVELDESETEGAETEPPHVMTPLQLDPSRFTDVPLDVQLEDAEQVDHSEFRPVGDYLSATPRPRLRRRRYALGAAALLVVAGIAGYLVSTSGDHSGTTVTANAPTSAPTAPITGAGAGDQNSGPGVILAYDFAYYVKRDPAVAASYWTNNTVHVTADTLKPSIDAVPVGTTHSLSITATTDPMVFDVVLTLRTPAAGAFSNRQQYTVSRQAGKYLIDSKIECSQSCPLP